MKTIILSQGKVAQVDDADYEWLSQWKWHAHKSSTCSTWYAHRNSSTETGKRYTILMHREILGLKRGELGPDHVDGDGLNNQRVNLRRADLSQQKANSRRYSNNRSGYKGVYLKAESNRLAAHIHVNKRSIHLGYFNTSEEAARAYDVAALKYFGEFACLNFPAGDKAA